MRLNAPKTVTWWLSVLLGAAGVVLEIISMIAATSILSTIGFWVVVLGLVLLILSTALTGL